MSLAIPKSKLVRTLESMFEASILILFCEVLLVVIHQAPTTVDLIIMGSVAMVQGILLTALSFQEDVTR